MIPNFKTALSVIILTALIGFAAFSVFTADAQDEEQTKVHRACINNRTGQIKILRAQRQTCDAAGEFPVFLSTVAEGALPAEPPIFEGDVQLVPGPAGPQGPIGPQGPSYPSMNALIFYEDISLNPSGGSEDVSFATYDILDTSYNGVSRFIQSDC